MTKVSHWISGGATCLIAAGLMTASAYAGTVYLDEVDFLNAAGSGLELESFERLPITGVNTDSITVEDFVMTGSPPQGIRAENIPAPSNGTGAFATDGRQYIRSAGSDIHEFKFFSPTDVFSVWITDAFNFGSGSIIYETDTGETGEVKFDRRPDANTLFFGFIADSPFSTITLTNTLQGDGEGFDEVRYRVGHVTPSPVAGLAGVFLLGAMALRRRRGAI